MANLNLLTTKILTSSIALAISFALANQSVIASTDIDFSLLEKTHQEKQQAIHHAIQQAKQQNLANHNSWQRLLYYSDKKQTSKVSNANFFISKQGQKNPTKELEAMITALLSPADANKGDQSMQCRFPARTHWLKQQLQLSLPKANCSNYQSWYKKYHPKQLSVVFAQEYPDLLPSAFAHTLLKIDTVNNKQYALNYTVDGKKSDSKLKYAKNAFTGGYGGDMSILPYQKSLNNYLSNHQRDVWIYSLKLTQAEREQLLRHVWEVKDLQLPYYFLTDNCASEILRLLDVIKPQQDLYAQVGKVAIPGDIMRVLESQKLLESGQFFPADKTKQQAQLNLKSFKSASNSSDHTSNSQIDFAPKLQAFADDNPLTGNHSHRASIGIGRVGDYDYQQLEWRLSYHDLLDNPSGYRQNLDMDGLRVKVRYHNNKKQNQASNEVDNLQLQQLILMRGRSYHPINTARKGKSWGMELSATQVNDASIDYNNIDYNSAYDSKGNQQKNINPLSQQHLVGNFRFEQGISYAFGKAKNRYDLPPQLCYALASGSAQVGKGIYKGFRMGVGANLGCAYQLADKLRVTGELELPYWYHGTGDTSNHKQGYWQPIANIGVQYDVAKNHGIRLTATHEFSKRIAEDTDVQLAWQWYF